MTTPPCAAGHTVSTRTPSLRPPISDTQPAVSPTRRPPKPDRSLVHPARSAPLGPSDFGVDRFTVPAVLDRRAEQYPDRVMMSIAGTDVTFAQMRQRSIAAATLLTELGVGRGDGVALFTGTCPEWVYFWLGAARIGAVSAAVNAANKGDFLLHTLRLSRPKVILTDAERRPRIEEIADRLDTVTDVVVQDDSLRDELERGAASAVPEACAPPDAL